MMRIELTRNYHPEGTNGVLSHQGKKICETIELPWRDNKRMVSCIPEGQYRMIRRIHAKHGDQLAIVNVPQREAILIHPANFALSELQGCIAPVTKCIAPGKGNYSGVALTRLKDLVYPVLEEGEEVYLFIKS
jgi:hypothetical protein